ncbi:MAG: hypothetical protein K6F39_04885 [Lachnospiraceae bacterium]|nr:hypothetical protein [Lachnospiraceae bacterium]
MKIVQIHEADFGCEERPDGEEKLVVVRLKLDDGRMMTVEEPDSYLYKAGIDEGSIVGFNGDHLVKIH